MWGYCSFAVEKAVPMSTPFTFYTLLAQPTVFLGEANNVFLSSVGLEECLATSYVDVASVPTPTPPAGATSPPLDSSKIVLSVTIAVPMVIASMCIFSLVITRQSQERKRKAAGKSNKVANGGSRQVL